MLYLQERVGVICAQLKKLALETRETLTKWQTKEGLFLHVEDAEADGTPFVPFESARDHWYGPDNHRWFRTEFVVPEALKGQRLFLNLRTQIDEWNDGKNPQFLVFLNGVATQGADMNHRLTPLADCAKPGEKIQIDIQAYTGTLHHEFCLLCDVCVLHEETWGLYYDLKTPLAALDRMKKDDQPRLALTEALNDAINLLDLRDVYSPEYEQSVQAARALLEETVYGKMAGHDEIIATCIGHTHIDVAWQWTVEQTKEKTARSFATVLELMKEYPDYRFMSSQPQLYAFLKARYPELYAQVKARVKEGRWEPEGGMWLEADCNLTSGESLVRQFLHGKRFFKEEFGVDNEILWLPDVFGYSGALPQICKRSGIKYFMTTKLAWNQLDRIPFDTFMWRGIDGSEVLSHLITTVDIGQDPQKNFFTTYNGMLHPDAIMGAWERYQQKNINNDILISYGYGDGGGGPTREMLEMGARMQKGVVGMPKVRQAGALTYFKELDARVSGNRRLPTWSGEFYFEYHRGTYTSIGRNKRGNRKSELALMDAELFGVLAKRKNGFEYPAAALYAMWETVLLDQFHDTLPGTAIEEVYEVTARDYARILGESDALIKARERLLAGEGERIVLFNTLGCARNDAVFLGDLCQDGDCLTDDFGASFPVQMTDRGACAFVRGLPSKGYKSFSIGKLNAPSPFSVSGRDIDTPYYTARFDENGDLSELYDKRAGRPVFRPGEKANNFVMYEDKPMNYDNWDIDMYYTEKSWPIEGLVSFEWLDIGPVTAALRVTRAFVHSSLTQIVRFYADTPRIDFETTVDWREHQHLLKVQFPLDLNTDEATFDIQFGNVKRKTHRNTSWDLARFESCAQKWMDVSDGGYGVSLLNDCKYGHSVLDGVLALTCLKSGIVPNKNADFETHVFTYALLPHQGSWREADTPWEAYRLNQPVRAVMGGETETFSLASTDQPNAVLETVKQAEDGDGIILRVYENQNARTRTVIRMGIPLTSVKECNLMEENEADIPCSGDGFAFTLNPYEVKTFRVQ